MKQFREVRPEDFDVELLMAAAREGRLYVDETRHEVSREEIIVEVRAYVRRIKAFVTKPYMSKVDDLWEQILTSEDFVTFLTPGCKAKKCKVFDKYSVMRIIGVRREKDVYERYSERKFDALLEPEMKDSPYRKYLGMGLEQRALLIKLRQIVAKFQL